MTHQLQIEEIPTGEMGFEHPPKYNTGDGAAGTGIQRSIISLALYIGLGYLLFRRMDFLLVITGIILFHEMGHFLAMKFYKYADLGVFFIPLLGAFVSGTKREVSQRQNAVILLAGPLPGIIVGFILFFIDDKNGGLYWGDTSVNYIALLIIWLNLINLLPIFPLDGGQLLNRVFLDEEGLISNIFILLSAAGVTWLAISSHFYFLLIIPVIMIFRYLSTRKHISLEKKILESGINLDTSYENLSDEDYWKIRAVIVRNTSAYAHVDEGPPFAYDAKEEKIAQDVENTLQRNLLMDISLAEKLCVIAIWALALASPWIFKIGIPFYQYFSR